MRATMGQEHTHPPNTPVTPTTPAAAMVLCTVVREVERARAWPRSLLRSSNLDILKSELFHPLILH